MNFGPVVLFELPESKESLCAAVDITYELSLVLVSQLVVSQSSLARESFSAEMLRTLEREFIEVSAFVSCQRVDAFKTLTAVIACKGTDVAVG